MHLVSNFAALTAILALVAPSSASLARRCKAGSGKVSQGAIQTLVQASSSTSTSVSTIQSGFSTVWSTAWSTSWSTAVTISPSSTPEATPTPTSSSDAPAQTSSSSSSTPSDGSNGSQASDSDVSTYLSLHNSIRAQYGASDVAWNNTLAAAAQDWADKCLFQHSGGVLGAFGENLAAGSGSGYTITDAVQSWTNEASQFSSSNPQASHFTQMVWKATTQVGCAMTSCAGGTIFPASYGSSSNVVCEYYPQGNVIGEFAQNVQ